MLYFFSSFVDDAVELDNKLKFYYEEYKTKLGITDLLIDQIMEDVVSK